MDVIIFLPVVSIGGMEGKMSQKPSYQDLEKKVQQLQEQIHRVETQKAEVEAALRENRDRYERMLAVVPDMISIHDPDMNILYSNWQGFAAVAEEKRKVHTKCHQTYRDLSCICPDCRAKTVMETREPFQEEVRLPDGMWVDLRVIPILDHNGDVEMFMEWVRNITERKQAEVDLESQKRLLEGVLDSIKDVIGVQLPDHTILRYNRAGYDILGLTRDQVHGKKCYELLGRSVPCDICATSRVSKSRTLETVETYIPELGRDFLCTSNPVLDDNGNIKLIIEQLTDITEKKKQDEAFQQSQKMESIGSLASGIAHDFNNILFPIVGLSEIMLDDFPSGSLEHQNLREIFKAGERGRGLVQQILSFSRQSEQQRIPIHLQKILKEVFKLCRATIPADIPLFLDIQSDCGPVLADPTQIHQIGMNLITNAFHAVEARSGTISVQLKETRFDPDEEKAVQLPSGPYAVLSVMDTGTGIDPAILGNIFDPYFTTKEKGRGTGLGLATVYGIVKSHGGDIRVDSEVGKGSCFHVYLPVLATSETRDDDRQRQPLPTGTEHILLVDDEASVVHLEKQMLQRLGYRITSFTSSTDALAAFRADPSRFDLVLTDMHMPKLTGTQLADALIAVRPDIPVIICTGFSEKINTEIAAAMGIQGLLMKPVVMKNLAEKVREVLDTYFARYGGNHE
jgi:PAS domain S-box-containing protein